jgi:hypothetical protein
VVQAHCWTYVFAENTHTNTLLPAEMNYLLQVAAAGAAAAAVAAAAAAATLDGSLLLGGDAEVEQSAAAAADELDRLVRALLVGIAPEDDVGLVLGDGDELMERR